MVQSLLKNLLESVPADAEMLAQVLGGEAETSGGAAGGASAATLTARPGEVNNIISLYNSMVLHFLF